MDRDKTIGVHCRAIKFKFDCRATASNNYTCSLQPAENATPVTAVCAPNKSKLIKIFRFAFIVFRIDLFCVWSCLFVRTECTFFVIIITNETMKLWYMKIERDYFFYLLWKFQFNILEFFQLLNNIFSESTCVQCAFAVENNQTRATRP